MPERIHIDPQIHFGKPCVSGTRIPVASVLELVELGRSFEEIRTDFYPELADEDIQACLRYARNLVEIDDIQVSRSA